MNHSNAIRLIEREFTTALPKWAPMRSLRNGRMAKLRGHLSGCESCRTYYDRLANLDTEMFELARSERSDSDALTHRRLEGLANEFFANYDESAPQQTRLVWATGLTASLAALLLAVWVGSLALDPTPEPTTLARGMPAANDRESRVALRVFTMTDRGRIRELRDTPTLAADAPLKVTYSNLDAAIGHLVVCSIDDTGQTGWLFPRDDDTLSVARDVIEELVAGEVRLGDMHAGSEVRLFALFSDEPIGRSRIETALRALSQRPAPTATQRLDIPDVLQDGLLLQVERSE